MDKVNLAEVELGDVFLVITPDIALPMSFLGMVVERRSASVRLCSIEVRNGIVSQESISITQRELDLPRSRPGRKILRLRPEYRRWREDPEALLCFAKAEPQLPGGVNLGELAHYNDCEVILADNASPVYEEAAARYRPPFYDHMTGVLIRQHITMFRLDNDAVLLKRKGNPQAEKFRPILPPDSTFIQVDSGDVLHATRGTVIIGENQEGSRTYSLWDGTHFAIETKVLTRAGLTPAG